MFIHVNSKLHVLTCAHVVGDTTTRQRRGTFNQNEICHISELVDFAVVPVNDIDYKFDVRVFGRDRLSSQLVTLRKLGKFTGTTAMKCGSRSGVTIGKFRGIDSFPA